MTLSHFRFDVLHYLFFYLQILTPECFAGFQDNVWKIRGVSTPVSCTVDLGLEVIRYAN